MRTASAILLCLLGAVAPARATPGELDHDHPSVVRVGGEAVCSAVLVRPDLAMTAKHCVWPRGHREPSSPRDFVVFTWSSERDTVRVDFAVREIVVPPGAWNEDADLDGHDIALLRLHRDGSLPSDVGLAAVDGGETDLPGREIVCVGYGGGSGPSGRRTTSPGTIAAAGDTLRLEPACGCPGDSGGGVFLAGTGELVGIMSRELPVGVDACDGVGAEATLATPVRDHLALLEGVPLPDAGRLPDAGAPRDAGGAGGGCAVTRDSEADIGAAWLAAALLVRRRRARPSRKP